MVVAADRAQRLAEWERHRSRGRTAFIWRNGVIAWGVPTALVTIAYKVFQERGGFDAVSLSGPFSPGLRLAIAICVVFFPAMGHVLGSRLWELGEERYGRLRDGTPDHRAGG